ncbi:hypothetical protein MLD38_000150 [Melastoma candidum]|uniref:Uncharacterized protein n=1 Tax=Melastoma candidum TaxID=119954 RepID=A0ACB9S9L5_9MYRT|nr:hypothetical protein MLD38_000150 [Melastoma candidum]
MNSCQYMEKQSMNLPAANHNDFIDLGTPTDSNPQGERILPSYDFHPIRPSSTCSIPSVVQDYSSMDSFDPAKLITEKDRRSLDTTLMSEIDQMMKKHTDNLIHALEGVGVRLTQLETRARNLENFVDDLKASVGNNHGSSDGKMRQLENILREVQTGVQFISDKQEILETQFQFANVQVSPPNSQTDTLKHSPGEPVQPSPSLPAQPFQQPPHGPPPQSIPALLTPNVSPPPAPLAVSQPNPPLATPAQVLNQFAPPQIPPAPQTEAYFPLPGHGQNLEAPTQQQQYQFPSAQLPHPPHHQYPPHSQPQYPSPSQSAQLHPSGPQIPQPQLGHRAEESTCLPPQTFQPNIHQPPSQTPSGPSPPPQQYYGGAPAIYEATPPLLSSSGFTPGYGHPSRPSEPSYGSGPQYGSGSAAKSQQHPQGGGMGISYSQLPTARILPQALPTASVVASGSGSGTSGNRVPIDDVVDKVTSMGFSRDQVRATVRRLTDDGQAVDLNTVLDKLMNDSDVQPPRGWFGR